MSDFRVGDRVVFHCAGEDVTGTIVCVERTLVHVQRDDGIGGTGEGGSFTVVIDRAKLISDVVMERIAKEDAQSKHRMGIDPEEIDWEGFKEFGRLL